ncbi:hypothetical protein NEF87_000308 [Candidatus Lokiarchaeum ossiferum]|uniref:CDP-alcohol phosphatidyltransferase family protein n=1 Tax=Candidatus Lokiarchaeum ossiferum TaxID=2951803 RepID=A0ABY6HKJ2_9ARCH|nr:hypothetical protein NEF87_000308 [Candidatus Lokiarchaeum sp. B-35]
MLDTRLNKSKLSKKIEAIAEKYLLTHISANKMTIIGLILGILSSILFIFPYVLNLNSGFQQALVLFETDVKNNSLIQAFRNSLYQAHLLNWTWQLGDTFFLLSLVMMLLSFTSDVFDGPLARLKKPTIFGGILDIFCDRTVELALIIAIVFSDREKLGFPGSIAISSIVLCISIFLLIGGAVNRLQEKNLNQQAKVIFYSTGIMERTETFIFILLMMVFSIFRLFLLYLFAFLVFLTAFQRFYNAYKMFYKKSSKTE